MWRYRPASFFGTFKLLDSLTVRQYREPVTVGDCRAFWESVVVICKMRFITS